jgi:hypothetical protein
VYLIKAFLIRLGNPNKKADSHLPFFTAMGERVDYSTAFTRTYPELLAYSDSANSLIIIVPVQPYLVNIFVQ